MFTGFASENTPAIQVWDFFSTFASSAAIRSVSLADDCAPIQVFRTGATGTFIRVYLPTAPIEGKQITIVNQQYGGFSQSIVIYSSDTSDNGSSNPLFTMGQGDLLVLVYSKQNITYGASSGAAQSGWIALNRSSPTTANSYSAIVGGNLNSSSGINTFVGSGANNTASGSYAAVVGGNGNTASNNYSVVVGGLNNSAGGSWSASVGGSNNTANSGSGAVVGGANGTARSITGNYVTPASDGPISTGSVGRMQIAALLLGRQTTDATATRLTSNSSAVGTTNQVILPNNSAYCFRGLITAGVTGGGNSAMWTFEGGIKRGANAAATTLIQSVINPVAADAGASTWIVALSADTTNGGLAVTVTGQAATTIRWACKIETIEVTF